jgi:broad specificity phosphatase PhoE
MPSLASKILSLASLLALALAPACASTPAPPPAPAPVTTAAAASCSRGHVVVVVRHAEKASQDKDPDLSERGRERARALATLLGSAGVSRVVATEYKRTQQTVGPLAEKAGVTIDVRPAKDTTALVRELASAPDGSVTVVATHSNVVPQIARELGAPALRNLPTPDALAEDDFARVLVLSFGCGAKAPTLVELSSG